MVRRRTRATKAIARSSEQPAVNVTLMSQGMEGAVAVAVSNGSVLEDQYFASPKRKDCKIDSEGCAANAADPLLVVENEIELISDSVKTRKSPSPIKSRTERGGISGRTIGVPLATRSQTRTIENFFKAKTAAKSTEIKTETVEQKCTEKTQKEVVNYNNTNDDDLSVISINSHSSPTQLLQEQQFDHDSPLPPILQRQQSLDAATNLQPDFIFDLSEDTTDSENTELSDEYSTASGGGASSNNALPISNISNFDTHRSPNRCGNDSNSSRSSTTDNIFLQEPVLTLNVDKSPNQASSIKINRTLEIEPIFSSPPAITASLLNGRFNQIVSLQCSPIKQRLSFEFEAQPPQPSTMVVNANCYALSAEHDTSSCDSGVAFGTTVTSSSSETFSPNPAVAAVNAMRRRKPATPHRIVCPSPIKAAPRMVSPACGSTAAGKTSSPSGRKLAASKDQLSPRKLQRHQASTSSKTRRRLNQPKEHQAPFQQKTTMQNGYNHQNGHVADDEHHHQRHYHIQDERADNQEYEHLHDVANDEAVSVDLCQGTPKSIQNNFVAATQLQQHKINKSHKHTTKAPTSIKHQVPAPPKIKLYQPLHTKPLAATNGNREMTEFFPVRRSERKTKTAVKEEMMRNLEQAILEERAEGLKIAHFENKGRGIVSERRFQRGEFVIEYVGDLISMTEAAEREKQYALDENAGCYMYYFKHKSQQYCIDATIDTGKLGRLVNHSRNGNLITKVVVIKQRPHLILIAKDDIEEGVELTYDYGDRSKESLLHHPWLAF